MESRSVGAFASHGGVSDHEEASGSGYPTSRVASYHVCAHDLKTQNVRHHKRISVDQVIGLNVIVIQVNIDLILLQASRALA